ncbi:MAG: type II secretion system protein N [Casimicrobiaceae bacterium]
MKRLALSLSAVVLLLAAIAVLAPAALLDWRLAAVTQGRLRLADSEGTVWNGRGVLTDAPGTWSVSVAWRVQPVALLGGVLDVTLYPVRGASEPRGEVRLSQSEITLKNVALSLPAAALQNASGDPAIVTLFGEITVEAEALRWDGRRGDGVLHARWPSARIAVADVTALLGTLTMTLVPRDARLAGTIANTGGDVGIAGNVAFAAESIELDATITPLAATPPLLARMLALLGPADSSGAVRLRWRHPQR